MSDVKKNLYKKINDYSIKRIVNEIRRLIISKMILDLVVKTKENIKKFQPKSSHDVRFLGQPLIEFSDAMSVSMREIRSFLTTKMYKHYEINRMTSKAKRIVSDLFKIYSQEADCLPNKWNDCLDHMINKESLEERGYTNSEIEKIMGKNILRVLEEIYN